MNSLSRCKPYLGTYVEIDLQSEESDDTLIDISIAAYAAIEHIESLMSFHDPESELSFLNRSAYQQTCAISTEMHCVLSQALHLSRATGGLFDITIGAELIKLGLLPDHGEPTDEHASWQDINLQPKSVSFSRELQIDLGGIAKGYAVDQAIALASKQLEITVNAGGDLRMSHWQNKMIAVRHPNNPALAFELPMQKPALATSASYYQEHSAAIISPRDKQAIVDSHSISVFADSCMLADALTKVAFLYPQSSALFHSLGANGILIDVEGAITAL